jgi:hypothetical protein
MCCYGEIISIKKNCFLTSYENVNILGIKDCDVQILLICWNGKPHVLLCGCKWILFNNWEIKQYYSTKCNCICEFIPMKAFDAMESEPLGWPVQFLFNMYWNGETI